jgi:hypothetical protein
MFKIHRNSFTVFYPLYRKAGLNRGELGKLTPDEKLKIGRAEHGFQA